MRLLYNLPASFYQIFLPMRVFRHTTDLDGYLCKLAPNVGTVDSAYQHETHAFRLEKYQLLNTEKITASTYALNSISMKRFKSSKKLRKSMERFLNAKKGEKIKNL